jgi:hypothetical protein
LDLIRFLSLGQPEARVYRLDLAGQVEQVRVGTNESNTKNASWRFLIESEYSRAQTEETLSGHTLQVLLERALQEGDYYSSPAQQNPPRVVTPLCI